MLALAGITVVINVIFTPEKLTPAVLRIANESLDANLTIKRVELTFFSTFPQFGLKVEEGTLVSKALTDTAFSRQDSLLSFKECILTVSPLAYLRNNKILIYNLLLKDASVYAYRNKEGVGNWEIMGASASDTIQVEKNDTTSFNSDIDIRNTHEKFALENENVLWQCLSLGYTQKHIVMDTLSFPQVVSRGCGIDVHKKVVVATIHGEGLRSQTREFGTFTSSLTELWKKS